MELPDDDALKTAEKLESEKLAMLNFDPARMVDLDSLLCNTYDAQCPKEIHYHNRRDLIRMFNVMSKEIYGNNDLSPVVEEYGSFVMEIFNERSDLDLSINFRNSIEISRKKKIETLRKFSKKLHKIQRIGQVTALEVILSAKVPIIKVTDSGTGIECDLSVENRDGIAKSHIIRAISSIDERFQKLCLLMKSWAKAHNINTSKDATLNSLSIVSFVAIHLQTRDPPILPPFSTLLKQGADPESVRNIVKDYTNYGKLNKESVAKLFVTFLVKLASVENLWQNGYCASSFEGSWILKSWKRPYSMSVEDFTDRSQNVSRAVRADGFKAIYTCIHNSIDYISRYLNGKIPGIELMDHLFGKPMVSSLEEGAATSNVNENKKNNPSTLQNPRPQKKSRLVKNQNQKSSENQTVRNLQQTEPQGTAQMHEPHGNTVHNNQKSSENKNVRDLQQTEPWGTARMHAPPSNTVPNNQKSSESEIIRDLQRTESWGTAQMHAPPSNTVSNNQKSRENKIVQDLQRTEPQGTARMHPPPGNIVPNNQKSCENKIVGDLQRSEPQSTARMHPPPGNIVPNNKKSSENKIVLDLQRSEPRGTAWMHAPPGNTVHNGHASFTPPFPYQSRYQSQFARMHAPPGNVPPPSGLNPVAYQGSYNPYVQSHHAYQGSYNPSIQSHHASLQNSGGYVHAFHQNAVPSNPHHSYVPHSSQPGRDYALYNQRSG